MREGYRIEELIELGTRFGLEIVHSDYYLTASTQNIIRLAHRLHQRLPAFLPLRELRLSLEERCRHQPYGILALYRK